MSYDGRIVRGPGDEADAFFQGNNFVGINIMAGNLTQFNVFGGNSFYLNGFLMVTQYNNALVSGSFCVITLYNGPNAGNLTGAVTLYQAVCEFPTTVPGFPTIPTAPIQLISLSNLNFRNRSGANGYFHVTISSALTASVTGIALGGPTALIA